MRRPVAVAWTTGLLSLALLLSSASWADDEERVHLRYQATGPCADRDAFVAQVGARTPRARWIERDEGVRIFDVRVAADPEQHEGYRQAAGTLTIRAIDGQRFTRRVESDSCADVIEAMALITALAIDPTARVVLPAAPPDVVPPRPAVMPSEIPSPPSTTTAPSGTAPPLVTGPIPTAETPLWPTTGPTPGAAPPAPAPTIVPPPLIGPGAPPATLPWTPPPLPAPRPARWRWVLGVAPRAASGLGTMSFVLPLFVDVGLDRDQLLAPSFRIGLSYLPSRHVELAEGAQADFFRLAAHPSACPIRLDLGRKLHLRPCLGAEIGALHGSGNLAPAGEATALWLAVVAPARLQWSPADWMLLELQAELGVPLIRQRYYFEPDLTVLEVDSVFGTLGGGVGVRFP